MKIEKIVVIGLGGIGSHLVKPLCRFLHYSGHCNRLTFADGDNYSFKNRKRQECNILRKNKALVQAHQLKKEFPKLMFTIFTNYIKAEDAGIVITENSVVFSCVDNHSSRKIISDQCKKLKNVLLISGGNELIDGSVQVFQRENSRNLLPAIDKAHPEIKYPEDKHPSDMSCEELERSGGEQVIFTNLTAATLMLNAFYSIISEKNERYSEVYFDILKNKSVSVERR